MFGSIIGLFPQYGPAGVVDVEEAVVRDSVGEVEGGIKLLLADLIFENSCGKELAETVLELFVSLPLIMSFCSLGFLVPPPSAEDINFLILSIFSLLIISIYRDTNLLALCFPN